MFWSLAVHFFPMLAAGRIARRHLTRTHLRFCRSASPSIAGGQMLICGHAHAGCDNMSAMVVLMKATAADLAALQQAPPPLPPPAPLPGVPNPDVFEDGGDVAAAEAAAA